MTTIIDKAKAACIAAHTGQTRKYTGEPYHNHPFEVEVILASVGASDVVRAAGLLHDVIEDTPVTYETLVSEFGQEIADLVNMVTDVSAPEDGNRKVRKNMDRDHLEKASCDGKTVKLADLISNTSSITQYDPGFAKVYMREKKDLLKVLRGGNAILHDRAKAIVRDYFETL